ncbi:MAG: TetR family transcriptional regulator [Nannocystis sp.]|uniref:TetR/AcrR family transcriptional regulator n=1 Tax=Nannocystis sp. TaxID=1962667 RepID=UPI0024255B86|nr:TetR/AcrR family transcriptional regulator [Nannocystis sp.]MBK9757449.1 TetR family transcriptional regulator [Nannocystis sp.]
MPPRKRTTPAPLAQPVKARAQPVKPAAPRLRDAEQTRADILRAARRAFATAGYARSGMRDIAAAAGITPALVVRYFGSKQGLFVAAIAGELALEPFLAAERGVLGRHIARHLFSKPRPEADILTILLLAAGDEEVRGLATELFTARIVQPLARWLGPPRAEARASLLLALISGAWMFRRALPLRSFAGGPDTVLVAELAAQLQRIVDGE